MERLPYNKRSHWTIERAGTIVLIGLSLFLIKYIIDIGYDIYVQTTMNEQLQDDVDQLEKEHAILSEIASRLESDEEYKNAYLNAQEDDIIYLPPNVE